MHPRFRLSPLLLAGLAGLALLIAFALFSSGGMLEIMDDGPAADQPAAIPPPSAAAVRELLEKHRPVLRLEGVTPDCPGRDRKTEKLEPASVELLWGQPGVMLRTFDRRLIAEGPKPADLFSLEDAENTYIDFPGSHRSPGCTYADDYWRLRGDGHAVVYGRLVPASVSRDVILQYYLFYFHNDFINKHEGDWEVVQVAFGVSSVEEALNAVPESAAYSGHAGGEKKSWDDSGFESVGPRPVVYVATGSHANYFAKGQFLGVKAGGSVFGCESTEKPHREVDPDVVVLPEPEEVTATSDFAWLTYRGLWGYYEGGLDVSGFQDGVTGPPDKPAWKDPVGWQSNLRDFSHTIPTDGGGSLGLGSFSVFCVVMDWVGDGYNLAFHDWRVLATYLVLVLTAAAGVFYVWPRRAAYGPPRRIRHIRELGGPTVRFYWRYRGTWILFSSFSLGAGIVIFALGKAIDLGDIGFPNQPLSNAWPVLLGLFFGIMSFSLIDSFVTLSLDDIDNDRKPVLAENWERLQSTGVHIVLLRPVASFLLPLLLLLLFVSGWTVKAPAAIGLQGNVIDVLILLLNIALAMATYVTLCYWIFIEQHCLLGVHDDESRFAHLKGSFGVVRGHEIRTCFLVALGMLILFIPGVIIGILFLAFMPEAITEWVFVPIAVVYAVVVCPFVAITKTLYYFGLQLKTEPDAGAAQAAFSKAAQVTGSAISQVQHPKQIFQRR